MCSPVSMLNDDCLAEIFLYLPLQQRVVIENGMTQQFKIIIKNLIMNLNDN